MLTPSGRECRYFYGDYYRGRHHEECRLLKAAGLAWRPQHCKTCPMPDIQRDNACEHLEFAPSLKRPFLILAEQVQLTAHCNKCACEVSEPRIGCGQCHALPPIFLATTDDADPPA
ncbi:MAG: hypothetical protein HYZ26_06660 [Chloroflexi bacterium]|nr:hypothetical protein [Chloroflexota bacterium]